MIFSSHISQLSDTDLDAVSGGTFVSQSISQSATNVNVAAANFFGDTAQNANNTQQAANTVSGPFSYSAVYISSYVRQRARA